MFVAGGEQEGRVGAVEAGAGHAPSVTLWLRNPVERLGLLSLARGGGHAVSGYGEVPRNGLAAALDAVGRRHRAVLVVALRDVDDTARALLGAAIEAGVRVLAVVDDPADIRQAGVRYSGVVLSTKLDAATFGHAVDEVLAGRTPIPAEVAHHLMSGAAAPGDDGSRIRLTPREQETLILLVDGLSNKQIATRLGVSGHGAKRLVANVLAKLDCSNRTAAVARALREGVYERYA